MLLSHFIFLVVFVPTISGIAEPTKICGNDDCSAKLFAASAIRDYPPNHEEFIKVSVNDTIDVYAIKFSNRPDIAEGINSEGIRGKFYINHIDKFAYYYFLFDVVKNNREIFEVQQSTIPGVPKLVKKHPANPYLWRDYKIRAEEVGENVEVEMASDPNEKKPHHHHHHHHHHDHSHHHGHDHSHGHDDHHHHDHSSHEQKEPPKTEEVKQELPPVTQTEQTPPPPVVDPLKKISLDAMKGIHKEVPVPNKVEQPPPQPMETVNPILSDNKVAEKDGLESLVIAEKAVELKEELNIASGLANSIIQDIASTLPDNEKLQEQKQENIAVGENAVTPPPVAASNEIPPTTLPPVPEALKDESQNIEATIPPLPVDTPTIPPIPVEEPKITNLEATTVQPADTPIDNPTTVSPVAAELPTTTQKPLEMPTTTTAVPPVEIPTPPPQPIEVPTTTTTSAPINAEIPTTPITAAQTVPLEEAVPVEQSPPTTTPLPEKVFHEAPIDPAVSVLQDEIRDRRALNEDSEYCYKNDCSGAAEFSKSTGFIATTIRPVLKSFSSGFRSVMPYPLSDFDDTGAFIFIFFILTTIMYFISWLFSDSGRPDVLDRRALHDALTKIKEQEVQIEQLRKNAADPAVATQYGKEIERLRKEKSELESKLQAMGQALQQRESEYREAVEGQKRLQNEIQEQKAEIEQLRKNAEDLAVAAQSEKEVERLKKEKSEMEDRLQDMEDAIRERENECEEAVAERKQLQAELKDLEAQIDQLKEQNESLKVSESGCIDVIKEMEKKLKEATKAAEEKTGSGGESNGSNGWSDMDMDLEHTEELKEAADIFEVVKLKAELRKVETERDHLKRDLENEQKNRDGVEQSLDQLKKTLAEKKSDLEQATKDKDYFRTQSENLSQRVAEYTQKIEKLQEDREKVFVLEKDILVLTKEKEEALFKIKDLEKALRKAEEHSTKLETRYFHEERRLKDRMYKLEEQLTKNKVSALSLESNVGSGNSSDRDFLVANRSTDVPSLWSDLEGPETSFDDSLLETKRESRRSIRDGPPMESGRRSVGRKEGQSSTHRRYRSRSAGRQRQSGGPSPYLSGGGLPPPPHLQNGSSRASPTSNYYEHSDHHRSELRRSTGRLSRNAQMGYYSSDGTGPLSPPPQIASKIEKKPNVLLHKPAPKAPPPTKGSKNH